MAHLCHWCAAEELCRLPVASRQLHLHLLTHRLALQGWWPALLKRQRSPEPKRVLGGTLKGHSAAADWLLQSRQLWLTASAGPAGVLHGPRVRV